MLCLLFFLIILKYRLFLYITQLLLMGSVLSAKEKKNSLPCMPYIDKHDKNYGSIEDLKMNLLIRDNMFLKYLLYLLVINCFFSQLQKCPGSSHSKKCQDLSVLELPSGSDKGLTLPGMHIDHLSKSFLAWNFSNNIQKREVSFYNIKFILSTL